jgi:hypothetical protein
MRVALLAGLLIAASLPPPARAEDSAAITGAIRRGTQYLRSRQRPGGSWRHAEMGATALAGLTLLECGAAPDDRAVASAARYVRRTGIPCANTYSISLAILFLDRLGEPADVPLIESLTVRLLAGQNAEGGWSYGCPAIPPEETYRLTTLLLRRRQLVGRRGPPPAAPPREPREPAPEIRQQIARLQRGPAAPPGYGDNSNTQFATLALWVARRHGLPVADALARLAARYRKSQRPDGGWNYTSAENMAAAAVPPPGGKPSPPALTTSMTCAGLLGLAVAHGAGAGGPSDIDKDDAIRDGLEALAAAPDNPLGGPKDPPDHYFFDGGSYYTLWSLERVGVVLGLTTLGGKDWYAGGARALVARQKTNGSWQGTYAAGEADTCFALLFLCRSNLARDLSAGVGGRIRDPGGPVLRTATARAQDGHAGAAGGPASRLAEEVVRASGAEQAALLRGLQEGRGVEYTEALAAAIGRLGEPTRQQAREALVTRLARMKPQTLGRYLSDEEPEIRRAAALACAARGLRDEVPRLIALLRDREPAVARAARAALRELSGRDLGADPDAWRAWWDGQRGK